MFEMSGVAFLQMWENGGWGYRWGIGIRAKEEGGGMGVGAGRWVIEEVASSLDTRILGECVTIQSPPTLFFLVEISSRTLIPLFRPGSVYSGSAS